MSNRLAGDHVFEALANPYRRRLLFALFDQNLQSDEHLHPLTLLSDGEGSDDPEAVHVKLDHCHLPKLAGMGVIEWDREAGAVSKGPEWGEIAPLLQLLSDHRDELPDEWVSGPGQ
ncbi:transcriptional regulator [Halomicroarcula sp. GCM10025709]|uniref:DUF7344 domain-containing protein n=1 Tax=Haloarcula TaxID=2237 RepID=UPI0024C2A16F|nr:ArsR family transcriptional regulator [Halomicroarcula sp. YJ-61-S]